MQEQVTVMITYYRTDDQVIHEEEKLSDGVWVQMINPTHDECEEIAEKLMVDIDDVKAALDVEESSRIELQDGYTLILVDIPAIEIRHDQRTYTTIPLGIILTQDIIVTICTEDTPVLQNFVRSRVKEFSTKKKLRFVYQILYRTAAIYQANLRIIDKRRRDKGRNRAELRHGAGHANPGRRRTCWKRYRRFRSDQPARTGIYISLLCDVAPGKWGCA